MRLKNYKPAKNEVLCELKHYQKIGKIITPDAQAEKIMKVLAVGPMCTATKPGDHVLMSSVPMVQLEFEEKNEDGKPIMALQGMEYNIMAYYLPEEDETRFFVQIPPSPEVERQGPQNIIDNPGIEQSPFLKDQANFLANLNN